MAPREVDRAVEVLIVGAGPSGLSAAWRLERLGEPRFVVLDLEAQPGGTSAFGTDGVVPYPWGAHYVPCPSADNRALVALLRELDVLEPGDRIVPKERIPVREPEERLYASGQWFSGLYPAHGASPADLAELERFTEEMRSWARRRDSRGRKGFDLPLARSSDDAEFTELDRMSARTYLVKKGYGSERLFWYVEYACRDDYGLTLSETSAWAMVFYFAARLGEGGSAPFLTWPEGNGRLVRHLAVVAGKRLELGRLVTDIAPGAAGADVTVVEVRSGAVQRIRARHVIVATPKFVTARIVRPFRQSKPEHLRAFEYGPWLVANVHLSRRPRSTGFPFAWDNVLYDSPSLGYVVATHQTLADRGPTIWTYYRPFVGDPKGDRNTLLGLDHDAIADAVFADLDRAHVGLTDAVTRIDAWRFGHAMVRPTPGFVWGEARRRARSPLGSVHFAHSDLSGVALFEEAQYHGIAAAEAVLRDRGREFESLLG